MPLICLNKKTLTQIISYDVIDLRESNQSSTSNNYYFIFTVVLYKYSYRYY